MPPEKLVEQVLVRSCAGSDDRGSDHARRVIIDRKMTSDSLEGITHNPHPWIQAYFHGERALRFSTHGT